MMVAWLMRSRLSTATRKFLGACRSSAARGCRFRHCSTIWQRERLSTSSSISSRQSRSNRPSPRSIWLGVPFWPVRVLLDENLPRALAAELTGHEVSTVQAAGWSGTTNGELLRRAQGSFDVLLSMDRGLQHQQDLNPLRLRIVVIRAPSNRRVHLKPLVGSILAARGENQSAFDERRILAACVAFFKYRRYSQSSCLVHKAPRSSRCDAGLSPRAARHSGLVAAWTVARGRWLTRRCRTLPMRAACSNTRFFRRMSRQTLFMNDLRFWTLYGCTRWPARSEIPTAAVSP